MPPRSSWCSNFTRQGVTSRHPQIPCPVRPDRMHTRVHGPGSRVRGGPACARPERTRRAWWARQEPQEELAEESQLLPLGGWAGGSQGEGTCWYPRSPFAANSSAASSAISSRAASSLPAPAAKTTLIKKKKKKKKNWFKYYGLKKY